MAQKPKQKQRQWRAQRERQAIKAAALDLARVTPAGEELGAHLVRLTVPVIARLVTEGEPDMRCASCAFRLGTVPNGCPQTGMDAMKAVLEGVPFYCHLRHAPVPTLCHGWYAGRVALRGTRTLCPWPFSKEEA